MTNIVLDKNITCAFSGHRELELDFNIKDLKEKILGLINIGYKNFLVGMAIGFDSECAKIIIDLKKTFDIKLIACVPCKEQDKNFNFSQKKEYKYLIENSNEVIVLSENYTPFCMLKRNIFMIDNCSVLTCYLRKNKGGTFNTYNYAVKKGIQIIKV